MQKTALYFPDAGCIADFIIARRIIGAEVVTIEHSLTANLSEEDKIVACTEYGAIIPKKDYQE